jgi:hypothetical protein
MIIVIYDVGPSFEYLLFYKNIEVHAPAIYTDEYCTILLKQVGTFKNNDKLMIMERTNDAKLQNKRKYRYISTLFT